MKRLPLVPIICLVVSIVSCSVLFTSCGSKQTPAELGKLVYESQDCKSCHLLAGQGNKGPGPDLSHIGSKWSAEKIRTQITDPAKIDPQAKMPAHTGIPKPDLDNLVAYLESLK